MKDVDPKSSCECVTYLRLNASAWKLGNEMSIMDSKIKTSYQKTNKHYRDTNSHDSLSYAGLKRFPGKADVSFTIMWLYLQKGGC